jgi:hypothetical protein
MLLEAAARPDVKFVAAKSILGTVKSAGGRGQTHLMFTTDLSTTAVWPGRSAKGRQAKFAMEMKIAVAPRGPST